MQCSGGAAPGAPPPAAPLNPAAAACSGRLAAARRHLPVLQPRLARRLQPSPSKSSAGAKRPAGAAVAIGRSHRRLRRSVWRLRTSHEDVCQRPCRRWVFTLCGAAFVTRGRHSGKSLVELEPGTLKVGSHGAVHFHHRRRGLLTWQGSGVGGARRAAAGARLQGPAAQARPLPQRRSRHDVAVPARRGFRHRRRRRNRSRPRPLRALHRPAGDPAWTTSPPAASTRRS